MLDYGGEEIAAHHALPVLVYEVREHVRNLLGQKAVHTRVGTCVSDDTKGMNLQWLPETGNL